jgi:hypothetical protein
MLYVCVMRIFIYHVFGFIFFGNNVGIVLFLVMFLSCYKISLWVVNLGCNFWKK